MHVKQPAIPACKVWELTSTSQSHTCTRVGYLVKRLLQLSAHFVNMLRAIHVSADLGKVNLQLTSSEYYFQLYK